MNTYIHICIDMYILHAELLLDHRKDNLTPYNEIKYANLPHWEIIILSASALLLIDL